MRKPLIRYHKDSLYHFVDGAFVEGPNRLMSGDCSGLRGYCSGLWGDLDYIPMECRAEKPDISDWVEASNA